MAVPEGENNIAFQLVSQGIDPLGEFQNQSVSRGIIRHTRFPGVEMAAYDQYISI